MFNLIGKFNAEVVKQIESAISMSNLLSYNVTYYEGEFGMYRVEMNGFKAIHNIYFIYPQEITFEIDSTGDNYNYIQSTSTDKQLEGIRELLEAL